MGVIYVFMYAIAFFAAFFVDFWMALLWLIPVVLGLSGAVGKDIPLVIKIPCVLAWMWGLNGMMQVFFQS